jgi:hypothetical protein
LAGREIDGDVEGDLLGLSSPVGELRGDGSEIVGGGLSGAISGFGALFLDLCWCGRNLEEAEGLIRDLSADGVVGGFAGAFASFEGF